MPRQVFSRPDTHGIERIEGCESAEIPAKKSAKKPKKCIFVNCNLRIDG